MVKVGVGVVQWGSAVAPAAIQGAAREGERGRGRVKFRGLHSCTSQLNLLEPF